MELSLRTATRDDLPFLREMLYEAVYWRSILKNDNPPFDEGISAPGVCDALSAWDERDGDTGLIAMVRSAPAGAAWCRQYQASNAIRGFINEDTPVLVLAVSTEYRRSGVGTKLCTGLIREASHKGIRRLSLMVSNDNHAYALYQKCGFRVHADVDGSRLMVRDL